MTHGGMDKRDKGQDLADLCLTLPMAGPDKNLQSHGANHPVVHSSGDIGSTLSSQMETDSDLIDRPD